MNKKNRIINNIIDKKISNKNYLVSLFNILNTAMKNFSKNMQNNYNILKPLKLKTSVFIGANDNNMKIEDKEGLKEIDEISECESEEENEKDNEPKDLINNKNEEKENKEQKEINNIIDNQTEKMKKKKIKKK